MATTELERQEAMRPDREKLLAVAEAVRAIVVPEVGPDMETVRLTVMAILADAADEIDEEVSDDAGES